MRRATLFALPILGVFYCKHSFAGTFDGVYKGTMDLNTTVANHPACSVQWLAELQVKDNHLLSLTTNTKPVSLYVIDIGPEGAFNGKASAQGDTEWRTFTGTIAGSKITGQFNNRHCHYAINFQRVQ
jgi:hypothetical protein